MNAVIEQIDREIAELEKGLGLVKGSNTEVYTRIVGYHRSVSNWNKGKREEYNHRVCFDVKKCLENEMVNKISSGIVMRNEEDKSFAKFGSVTKYMFFYGEYCRNCKPVKEYIDELSIEGEHIDTSSELGLAVARQYNVMSTPTVIMFNSKNEIIAKLHSKEEIEAFLSEEKAAIA